MQTLDHNIMTEQQIAEKAKIEKEMLNCLRKMQDDFKDHKTLSQIKIWNDDERIISDKEIFEEYSDYYSILIQTKFNKKLHKAQEIVSVGKNGEFVNDPNLNRIMIRIPSSSVAILKTWSKEAFKILKKYFYEYDLSELREVRFDFLPEKEKDGFFILPYLPLDSITISKDIRSKSKDMYEFLNSRILTPEDLAQINQNWISFNNGDNEKKEC